MNRRIDITVPGHATTDGAGVKLKRILSYPQITQFDPFLMLDSFGSDSTEPGPGFPWHPHRGIVTITYMLKGGVYHEDSMGNFGTIAAGGVQWMKAGSGVIHQEMPQPGDEGIAGFQFWLNLPAAQKMSDPDYGDILDDAFLRIFPNQAVQIKIIAGELDGVKGPVQFETTQPEMYDIVMEHNSSVTIPTSENKTFFVVGIEGSPKIEEVPVNPSEASLLTEGDSVTILSEGIGRLLLVGGIPLHEPIAWEGPVVMNSQEELVTAFREYHQGTFVKGENHAPR